jgi:Holliday junction resolvasome RuvABC endonuclease subunit
MRDVGIDPSLSRTGICILSGEHVIVKSIKTSRKMSVFERQTIAVAEAKTFIQRGEIVALEEFGISARFAPSGRFVERIEMCGMLKFLSPRVTGLPWFCVPPNLLKKFVTGKASAKKIAVMAATREKWRVQASNDDEADAFGLAAYVRAVFTEDHRFVRLSSDFLRFGDNLSAYNKIKFLEEKK